MPSLCKHPDCRKGATFGLIVGKRLFCKEHKTAVMVPVTRFYRGKLCEHDGCETIAYFGIKGSKKTHCANNDLFVGAYSGKWIFIRFNPDAYTDSKGKRRKGMFDSDGKQICHEVKRRKQVFIEEIEKQIKRIESDENYELFEIKKLFFDGF